MRSLLICMSSVVGSNAHQTTLRHTSRGYANLFGPPLVFTTVNPSDTRSVIVKLMYEGADVARWRCELDKEAPEMFSVQGMNRVVARDPVAMAEFFDLTLRLFLRHVVGVSSDLHADGVASACGVGGVFGPVLAYFAAVETQGRGGLHPHMHVWILHPFQASMLAKLRAGEEIPDLARRVDEWNAAVLEHVPTVQFDSVEEVGRQVGVLDVAPLPYSNAQRQACWTAAVEDEVEEPRVSAPPGFRTYANWTLSRRRDGLAVDLWTQLRQGNANMCQDSLE